LVFVARVSPPRIRELLHRCLQKEAKQRLRDIGDARIIIEEALSGSVASEGVPAIALTRTQRREMVAAFLFGSLVLSVVEAGFVGWYLHPTPRRRGITRFAFSFPAPGEQPAASAGLALRDFPVVAISRDGSERTYVGRRDETTQLFLRPLDRLESQPLPGTVNATSPFFSPDGQGIGFFADGKLKKVSVHGGEPVALCDARPSIAAALGALITRSFSLPLCSPDSCEFPLPVVAPQVFNTPDVKQGERSFRWPEILPGGKAVVFVVAGTKDIGFFSESRIAVEELDKHEKKFLPIQGTNPRYSPSGHLLFVRMVACLPFPSTWVAWKSLVQKYQYSTE
jgi:eukaryotic-like serine/threonine-protein kinase